METQKTIDVLNDLIVINNDRIEGYKTASGETQDSDLKQLFSVCSSTSQKCKQELASEVGRLGGEVAEGTMVSGKIFRAWMDVKAVFTGKDRKAILESCEFGEDAAVKAYRHTLTDHLEDLSAEQQNLVRSQYDLIKAEHDQIRSLRDAS